MRWAHKDAEATKAAKFMDRRSWIGQNSEGLYVRMAGKDMVRLRGLALERDGCKCVDCGSLSWLELSHDIPRGRGGSDVLENVHIRCHACHVKRDGHGQPMYM